MSRAVGFLELNSIARGIFAGDAMLKAAAVKLVMAQPVCAGKYMLIVSGDTAAVEASVAAGNAAAGSNGVDHAVLSNIDDSVLQAMATATSVERREAVGVIETFSLTASILAADIAVKAARVELIEVRLGRGLGGKSFVLLTGQTADVKASVSCVLGDKSIEGMVVSTAVIPSLHEDMYNQIL